MGVGVEQLGPIAAAMQQRILAAYEDAPQLADLLGPVGVETLDDVAEYDWVTVGIYAFWPAADQDALRHCGEFGRTGR